MKNDDDDDDDDGGGGKHLINCFKQCQVQKVVL
jgi:hypothetical protein